jgi:hypothetical protein
MVTVTVGHGTDFYLPRREVTPTFAWADQPRWSIFDKESYYPAEYSKPNFTLMNSQIRMSLQDYDPNNLGQAARKHRARGYQLEMLDESLKQNIIVAVFITISCLLPAALYLLKADGHWKRENAYVSYLGSTE